MVDMSDFDVEVADNKEASIENVAITIPAAGSPVTVSRTDGKDAQLVVVINPNKGVRANTINTVIYVSFDGQVPSQAGITITSGGNAVVPGKILNGNLKIDTNVNGANAELILWG